MPDTTRTFIAVAVPATLELKLTRLQLQLAVDAPEARWEVPPPFHVTLAFLGDVDHGRLNDVCTAAAEAAAPFERFQVKIEGLGAYPSPERPRVVWAGVGEGTEPLRALQAAVVSAVARLGYPPENRPYHPHITLGRFNNPGRRPARDQTPGRPVRDLTHAVSHYRTWHAGPFPAAEAVVFSSTLTREGPVYSAMGRAPFRGRKTGTSP